MKQQIYHSIEIGLHSKCNLHCPLCTRSKKFFLDNKDHRKFNNELDFEDLKNAILTIKPQELKLVGAICEPTMYYKFIELLEFCKEQNISIWLSTNGSYGSEKFWERVTQAIPKNSVLNFDIGHTQKQLYRKSNTEKIIRNIKIVQKGINPEDSIRIEALRIEFNWNKDDEKNLEELTKDLGIGLYKIPCYDYNPNEFKEDISFWDHPKKLYYQKINKLKILNTKEINCEALTTNSIYINYLGYIMPCCYINDLLLSENIELYETGIRNKFLNIKDRPIIEEITLNYRNAIDSKDQKIRNCCSKFCSSFKRKLYKNFKLDP